MVGSQTLTLTGVQHFSLMRMQSRICCWFVFADAAAAGGGDAIRVSRRQLPKRRSHQHRLWQ